MHVLITTELSVTGMFLGKAPDDQVATLCGFNQQCGLFQWVYYGSTV